MYVPRDAPKFSFDFKNTEIKQRHQSKESVLSALFESS